MALEEPEHVVVYATEAYEVRHYPPYLVAEVDAEGDSKQAGNKAFRILAGYIFGDNSSATKMRMTAPVEAQLSEQDAETAMTAETGRPSTRHTYRFVMERKYDLESLPRPNDARIRLRAVAPKMVAATRYSGRWTENNYDVHKQKLIEALRADEVTIIGEPVLARYNSPFTPSFLRRNEVLIEVAWPKATVLR